jgi:hypothetical protein
MDALAPASTVTTEPTLQLPKSPAVVVGCWIVVGCWVLGGADVLGGVGVVFVLEGVVVVNVSVVEGVAVVFVSVVERVVAVGIGVVRGCVVAVMGGGGKQVKLTESSIIIIPLRKDVDGPSTWSSPPP